MNKLSCLALSVLATNLLVGCVTGDNDAPPADEPAPDVTARVFPRTCSELVKQDPSAQDGPHRLYIDGELAKPWLAYCVDMQSSPKEYLTLPQADTSWSRYSAGGRATGTEVETKFDKVRIDPLTLKIDISDMTFAVSTGSLVDPSGNTITSLPFGVAMTCGGGYSTAQVNVQGTPFILEDKFSIGGDAGATGNADPWWTNKVVEMWTDGDCGWVGPDGMTSPTSGAGGSIGLIYER